MADGGQRPIMADTSRCIALALPKFRWQLRDLIASPPASREGNTVKSSGAIPRLDVFALIV